LKGRRHDGSAERWGAAVAVSVAVHAGILALVASFHGAGALPPRQSAIVVALMEGTGGAPAGGPDERAARGGVHPDQAAGAFTAAPAIAAASVAAVPESGHQAARRPTPALHAPRQAAAAAGRDPFADRDQADAATLAGAAPDPAAPPAGGARADGGGDASAAGGTPGGVGDAPGASGGAGGAGGGDLRAWCRSCPRPEYPARARREGWQGTVDVELHVDRDGVVEHASVERSSGFAVLDAAAVTVARQSRFAVPRGESLRGQLRYRFVLEDGLSGRPL
jgi:protein TonB